MYPPEPINGYMISGFDTPVKDSGATHRYIGMKLDAIYTRGFGTKRFATARAQDVSDHLALWATMAPAPSPVAGALASTVKRPVLTARRVAFPTP